MTAEPTSERRLCGECGATLTAASQRCWMCRAPVDVTDGRSPYASPESEIQIGRTFQIASLMLTTVLIAVFFGVLRISLGAGIALIIVATPAYLRTFFVAARRRASGRPLGAIEKVGAFVSSTLVVLTIVVASGAAFYATCWVPVGLALFSDNFDAIVPALLFGILAGVVIGGWVAYLVTRKLWPRSG